MQDTQVAAGSPAARHGLYSIFFSYVLWGLLPIYWKQLDHVNPLEIICHRTLWSLVFVLLIMAIQGGWAELRAACRVRANVVFVGLGSFVHLGNWLVYIYGVNSGQIVAVSLGQYIVPLLSIFTGFLLFHERLRRLQWMAIVLAFAGVLAMVVRYGVFPWLSLVIAGLSVLFSVLRKQAPVGVMPGMVMELSFNTPLALACLTWMYWNNMAMFRLTDVSTDLFLMGAGIVTATPQILYIFGLRRVNMITLGFAQYTLPTFVVLIGVFVYNEPFTSANAVGFGCIWAALVLYTLDNVFSQPRFSGWRKA